MLKKKKKRKKKFSLFLNNRTMQFHQSSPVQPNYEKKISEDLKKIPSFQQNLVSKERKKLCRKKCYFIRFSILGGRDSTRALQSSPFKNPDEGRRTEESDGQKSLCLNLDIVLNKTNFLFLIFFNFQSISPKK